MSFLLQQNRQTVRASVNPLDKSTVVSIFPKEIDEQKHTIQPGRFIIPPGSLENPAVLTVGPSSWWRDVDPEQPLIEIPTSSILVAESIVKDYCVGYLGSDMDTRRPGLFFLPGEWTAKKLKEDPIGKEELNKANEKQINWYKFLVLMADALWATSNGNPRTISPDMKLAATELNVNHLKEWTRDNIVMDLVRCVACGSLKNPQYPICQHCKAISDPEKAKSLGIKFAV